MANGTNGNSNMRVYVLAGAVVIVAFLASIVGLAFAGVDVTPFVTALAAILGALVIAIPGIFAAREARLGREENAKTNVVLDGVSKQVDGMTTKYTDARVGQATAEATAIEKQVGVDTAADVKVVSDAALAEAQAAPAVAVPMDASVPIPVTVVNPVVPVVVVDKKKE